VELAERDEIEAILVADAGALWTGGEVGEGRGKLRHQKYYSI